MNEEHRPELHLMVLWEKARSHEQEILADLPQHLTILRAFDIGWTPERVQENYSRFYGVKLTSATKKTEICGGGRFLLLVLRDEQPRYGLAETTRGHERVNLDLFELKQHYRALMGGTSVLHATNSVQETDHDAALLLGLNYEDLAAACTTPWDGTVTRMERDITGTGGWESLPQFFYTLNAAIPYVVLRNEEILPEQFSSELHGDIDLLTDNFPNLVLLTGGVPKFPESYRVHYAVRIGGQDVMFDFRSLGDDYYCREFEQHLLDHRVRNEKGIYVAEDEDALYALIYHALVHKRKIAEDYFGKIQSRFEKLGLHKQHRIEDYTSPFDLYYRLLRDFMQRRNYHFIRPQDASVFFCRRTTEIEDVAREFEKRYGWKNITPIHCESLGHGCNLFFSAEEPNGQGKLFIKYGKRGGIYKNEYRRAKELYALAPRNVVEPLYWRDSLDFRFDAARWTEGETLEDLLAGGTLTAEQKAALLEDILTIFQALQQSDIVHRDLIPRNLLHEGGHLKLIDFQFAVSKSHYTELKTLRDPKHYRLLCSLGRLPDERRCIWDDAYALVRIIRTIGSDPSYAARYEEILNLVSAAIGKHALVHPERETLIYYLEHGRLPLPPTPKLSIGEKLRRLFTGK